MDHKPTILVIVPPWPKTGSSNLWEASIGSHQERGYDVFVLVAAVRKSVNQSPNPSERLAEDMAAVASLGADYTRQRVHVQFLYLRTALSLLLRRGRSFLDLRADYVASAKLPEAAERLIQERPIAAIHVHHCWNMRLAKDIQGAVQAAHGTAPSILCETHDIQSRNLDLGAHAWPIVRKSTTRPETEAAEIALCGLADQLIHINDGDLSFFRERLPRSRHGLLTPTIAPESEYILRALRRSAPTDATKLVYLAAPNQWNFKTSCWLLEKIVPRVKGLRKKLAICGAIRSVMQRERPRLFEAYEEVFVGQVPSIGDAYREAKAVLAPALGGSGSSIKILEAMCLGRPVIATPAIMRGIDPAVLPNLPVTVCDDDDAFVAAVEEALRAPAQGTVAEVVDAYEEHFSTAAYARKMGAIIEHLVPRATSTASAHGRSLLVARPDRVGPPADWTPPPRAFLVAAPARSGSTLLAAGIMVRAQVFGKPREFFNEEWMSEELGDPQPSAESCMRYAGEHGRAADGTLGIKFVPPHLHFADSHLALEQWLPQRCWIRLRRRDLLGQAISHAIATQTGAWSTRKAPTAMPRYDFGAILAFLRAGLEQDAYLSTYFALRDENVLELCYEDFEHDHERAVASICSHFDIDRPAAPDERPMPVNRQRTELNEEWRARFLADAQQLGSLEDLELAAASWELRGDAPRQPLQLRFGAARGGPA